MADQFIMVGPIKIERVKGGRQLTHPSGLIVFETDEQIAACRAEDVAAIAELEQEIAERDALVVSVGKLEQSVAVEAVRR